jgi:hypothetical protein
MNSADKIKQSMQVATTLSATQVVYGRGKLKKMKLLSIWLDNLNQKDIPLTQTVITEEAK